MTAFGIDFGTTNSVLGSFDGHSVQVVPIDDPPGEWATLGFDRLLPSVIATTPSGNWTYGWEAKRSPTRLDAVKRLLATEDSVSVGGTEILAEEAGAALFGRIRSGAAAAGVDFDQAVVTVPANSRGVARHRTRICAGLAGIETTWLLNEPTAAAMAFANRVGGDQTVLVVDIGGGTTDVTLLQVVDGMFMEQASSGVVRLGGIDFDRAILRNLESQIDGYEAWTEDRRQELRLNIELAKIRLSSQADVALQIPEVGPRRLSRHEVDRWLTPLFEKVDRPILGVVADAGMSLSEVDHLVLIGGGSKVPALRERIAHLVDREPTGGVDPMTAVAEGAALAAGIISGSSGSSVHVTTEHSLGLVVADPDVGTSFSVMIERNSTLPFSHTQTYVPWTDYQEEIELIVVEGDERRPLEDEDNIVLDGWSIRLPETRTKDEAAVEVTYSYDQEGLLRIRVVDRQTDAEIDFRTIAQVAGRDAPTLVEMHRRVEEMAAEVEPAGFPEPADPEFEIPDAVRTVLDRARTNVMPFVSDSDAATVGELADRLESAVGTQDQEPLKLELEQMLRKCSYLY